MTWPSLFSRILALSVKKESCLRHTRHAEETYILYDWIKHSLFDWDYTVQTMIMINAAKNVGHPHTWQNAGGHWSWAVTEIYETCLLHIVQAAPAVIFMHISLARAKNDFCWCWRLAATWQLVRFWPSPVEVEAPSTTESVRTTLGWGWGALSTLLFLF